jgi:Cu+-exporting ATPase
MSPSTTETTLTITGMTCAACVRRVTTALHGVPGVQAAAVDLITRQARVTTTASVHGAIPQVLGRIRDLGYDAEPVADSQAHAIHERATMAESRDLARAAILAALLTTPVVILAMSHGSLPGTGSWWDAPLQILLTTAVMLGPGRSVLLAAWRGARHGSLDMNTLVTLGVLAAWSSSVVSWAQHLLGGTHHPELYAEAAAVILTAVLTGRWLEVGARRRLADAVAGLAALQPDHAERLVDGLPETVPAASLTIGDVLRVRPGDRFPIDGVILTGQTLIDAALVTGESLPTEARPGDTVHAGTLNRTGVVTVRATAVGAAATIGRIMASVVSAQTGRAPIARMADRISAVFVPVVLGIALLTVLGWMLAVPGLEGLRVGIGHAVAVLVIACPCALGLATPAAISVGIARAAQLGILVRGGAAIETASRVDTVLLDKTGTLTTGEPRVVDILPLSGMSEERLLHLTALVEVGSEHPLGRAVVRAAQDRGMDLRDAPASTVVPGHGLSAQVDGCTVAIGTSAWLESLGVAVAPVRPDAERLAEAGRTPLIAAIDGVAAGVIGVLDTPTPAARQAVADLLSLGVDVAMVTGDRAAIAQAVARDLGISTVHAETTPEGKAALVAEAHGRGRIVAMVGDGLNDAPAVAGADLGIAMGSGTQVAQAAADVVLAQGGIAALPATLRIAHATTRAIRQNLAWAFAFNLMGIPIAAGILVPSTGWSLSPMIASAAMALSSTMVLLNAWRLRFALRHSGIGQRMPADQSDLRPS